MSGETGICRMCGDTVDFHTHDCHPYIIDDLTWSDRISVNGRISKKLFEKVITPKLKEIEALRKQRDEAIKIVEFYADEEGEHWAACRDDDTYETCCHITSENSGGKRAREFLGKLKNKEEQK